MNWRQFQTKQKVAEIGQHFVSYIDEGAGEPVLLLHGIPTWSYLWHELIPTLSKSNRVLAPDLLGFGFSDKGDRFDRSIARQAQMLDTFLTKMGVARANIVGHDIGGGVALRLATLFPARVLRLCVMNTVCYDSWPIELMLQFGHPAAHRKLAASTATALLKKAVRAGFAFAPTEELLEGLLAPYATEVGKLSLIRNASALNTNLTTEIAPLLPHIGVPTLILWGEDDLFQHVKYGQRLQWDIPHSRLVRIKDARHFVFLDKADAVREQLLSFLLAPHGVWDEHRTAA